MAKIYYENQADLANLAGKKIAVLGYGSQGHAHALSLQDSGLDVRVGLYPGSRSWAKAEADGVRVLATPEAAAEADIIMFTLPDPIQAKVYEQDVAPTLKEGDTLMFAHGFNIRFGFIQPPANVDVSMVAPKAPGHRVREVFKEGSGVPALVAVHQDSSGKALANAGMVVSLSPFKTNLDISDVLLPIAPFSETSGSFVNAEGRLQSFHAVVKPLAETRPAWKVLRVLGNLLGLGGFGQESSQEVLAQALPGVASGEFVSAARLNNRSAAAIDTSAAAGKPCVASIYQLDALVRRAGSLQLTADGRTASEVGA